MLGAILSIALIVAAISIPLIFMWKAESIIKLIDRFKS
jgi:hypothetical protein